MINWAKFGDPFAIESAGFSDMVYPLTHAIVNQVEAVNHAAALLSSDMLHNAHDRRFAIAQSSPVRRGYDFRSNKVRQMECAVDTLSSYIRHREALYYDQLSTDEEGEDDDKPPGRSHTNFQQDISGMTLASIPQDQLSECQLSPSPPTRTPLPSPSSMQPARPSPQPARNVVSRAGSLLQAHAVINPAITAPVSTAPTTFSHGLSIADLIHPSPPIPAAPKSTSPPLTPDPDLDQENQALHSPNQDFLQATLASIRAHREIGQGYPVPAPTYYRASSSPRVAGRGRNLKFPRMRRSSKSRKCDDQRDLTTSIQINDSKPESVAHASEIASARSHRERVGATTSSLTHSQSMSQPERPERTALDAWWDTQRQLHHCEQDDEEDTLPGLAPKPLLYSQLKTVSGSRLQSVMNTNTTAFQPRGPSAVLANETIEVDDVENMNLYAYTRPNTLGRSSTPQTATYKYGYIAGDVPGARDGKLRVRSQTRERTRGSHGKLEGKQRAVSGIKRARGASPGSEHQDQDDSKRQKGAELCGDTSKLPTGVTLAEVGETSRSKQVDDDEVDQDLIREAQRLAERWWKEPLVPSTS
jgi:hypothetical protein